MCFVKKTVDTSGLACLYYANEILKTGWEIRKAVVLRCRYTTLKHYSCDPSARIFPSYNAVKIK